MSTATTEGKKHRAASVVEENKKAGSAATRTTSLSCLCKRRRGRRRVGREDKVGVVAGTRRRRAGSTAAQSTAASQGREGGCVDMNTAADPCAEGVKNRGGASEAIGDCEAIAIRCPAPPHYRSLTPSARTRSPKPSMKPPGECERTIFASCSSKPARECSVRIERLRTLPRPDPSCSKRAFPSFDATGSKCCGQCQVQTRRQKNAEMKPQAGRRGGSPHQQLMYWEFQYFSAPIQSGLRPDRREWLLRHDRGLGETFLQSTHANTNDGACVMSRRCSF